MATTGAKQPPRKRGMGAGVAAVQRPRAVCPVYTPTCYHARQTAGPPWRVDWEWFVKPLQHTTSSVCSSLLRAEGRLHAWHNNRVSHPLPPVTLHCWGQRSHRDRCSSRATTRTHRVQGWTLNFAERDHLWSWPCAKKIENISLFHGRGHKSGNSTGPNRDWTWSVAHSQIVSLRDTPPSTCASPATTPHLRRGASQRPRQPPRTPLHLGTLRRSSFPLAPRG